MAYARISELSLHYQISGDGPALVFAHGGAGNHLSWWQQVPEFDRDMTVVTFDHRGFGLSRDEARGSAPHRFVDDLEALLDHLNIDRAALVGQSMGGITVAGFASQHPERVTALVLCDTPAGIVTDAIAAVLSAMPAEGDAALGSAHGKAFHHEFATREPHLAFLYGLIDGLNDQPIPNLIPTLTSMINDPAPVNDHRIPTLVVVGSDDAITPPSALRSLPDAIPHASFIEVAQAGHSPYFEQATVFNDVLRGFLEEQGVLESTEPKP
jgi:pimeloyl-ACP methyl ester carboxylesterase